MAISTATASPTLAIPNRTSLTTKTQSSFSSSNSSFFNNNTSFRSLTLAAAANGKRSSIKKSGFSCNCLFGLGVPELAVIAGVAISTQQHFPLFNTNLHFTTIIKPSFSHVPIRWIVSEEITGSYFFQILVMSDVKKDEETTECVSKDLNTISTTEEAVKDEKQDTKEEPEKPALEPVKTDAKEETKSTEGTPKEEKTTPKQSLMGKVKKSFIKTKKAIIGKNNTSTNTTPTPTPTPRRPKLKKRRRLDHQKTGEKLDKYLLCE